MRAMNPHSSWLFREPDRKLYAFFGGYCLAFFVAIKASYGYIMGYLLLGTAVPALALFFLILFQAAARPRCSPLAFVLVLLGLLASAVMAFTIAAEASAAA
jgi:hypothetical protein